MLIAAGLRRRRKPGFAPGRQARFRSGWEDRRQMEGDAVMEGSQEPGGSRLKTAPLVWVRGSIPEPFRGRRGLGRTVRCCSLRHHRRHVDRPGQLRHLLRLPGRTSCTPHPGNGADGDGRTGRQKTKRATAGNTAEPRSRHAGSAADVPGCVLMLAWTPLSRRSASSHTSLRGASRKIIRVVVRFLFEATPRAGGQDRILRTVACIGLFGKSI
jgi:hypothetical protein